MKILLLGLVVGITIIATVLFYENLALQQSINLSNDNLTNTNLVLNEYEKQFGNITIGYDTPSMSLEGKIYLIEGFDLTTNTQANESYTIKINHQYLVQAQLTRMKDVKPSLIYYVCHVQILNSTGYLVESGWGDTILIPKYNSSNCALQWIPDKPGNYTAQVYASEDEIGSSPKLYPSPEVHIHVLS